MVKADEKIGLFTPEVIHLIFKFSISTVEMQVSNKIIICLPLAKYGWVDILTFLLQYTGLTEVTFVYLWIWIEKKLKTVCISSTQARPPSPHRSTYNHSFKNMFLQGRGDIRHLPIAYTFMIKKYINYVHDRSLIGGIYLF